MAYFPMFIELQNAPVLVVGGGKVALRKVKKLLPYGANITVVAPKMEKELEEISEVAKIYREFDSSDLLSCPTMVIAATDQKEVNEQIAYRCKEQNIPVNVADDVENCSFLFPSLVKKGKLSAGICTGGSSPTAAIYCKERLQEVLPDSLDEILDWLEEKRPQLKAQIPIQSTRAGIYRKIFDKCMEKGRPLTEEEWWQIVAGKSGGSVTLVGAGCGKADLITVKGLRLLQQCDAVVYDDLIDLALLDSVPETADRIYMGKRSGHHFAPQEEINQTLVALAKQGKKVVRLKGGDPYLFGRGGEEMQALLKEGIPCQEVPGIPSAIGIAAEAGIPVTHRGASRGLHIVTAHTTDTEDGLPEDFDALAQLSGTLVFLMGLRQLPKIVKRLLAAGKSGDTPAAVLSGGNSKNPARVRAKLSEIEAAAEKAGVSSPAIIVIGEVAALDFHEKDQLEKPVKIGITGTEEIARKQQKLFEEQGAETVWFCRSCIKEREVSFESCFDLESPKWIVFTSANGVKTFFHQAEKQQIDFLKMKHLKYAVIGSATGKALEQYGVHADLCPEIFTSKDLANALVSVVKPEEEILLFRSSIGSPELAEIPTKAGLQVQDIPIYDLQAVYTEKVVLEDLDYLTFSSASGVRLFFEQYPSITEKVQCVCIGEVTAKEFQKYSEKPVLLAKEISVEGIWKTIEEDIKSNI